MWGVVKLWRFDGLLCTIGLNLQFLYWYRLYTLPILTWLTVYIHRTITVMWFSSLRTVLIYMRVSTDQPASQCSQLAAILKQHVKDSALLIATTWGCCFFLKIAKYDSLDLLGPFPPSRCRLLLLKQINKNPIPTWLYLGLSPAIFAKYIDAVWYILGPLHLGAVKLTNFVTLLNCVTSWRQQTRQSMQTFGSTCQSPGLSRQHCVLTTSIADTWFMASHWPPRPGVQLLCQSAWH